MSEQLGNLVQRLSKTSSRRARITILICGYLAFFALPFAAGFALQGIHAAFNVGRNRNELSNGELVFLLLLIGVCVLAAALWASRVGSWAGTAAPKARAHPADAATLRAQLLAINELALPFKIREKTNGDLVAEWQIADAQWATLMGAKHLSKQHKITMRLCKSDTTVRVIEEDRTVSWNAGIARVGFSMQYFRGIVFYQYERGVEGGLSFKNAKWQLGAAYRYRFADFEMRNPLMHAAVHNGWAFRPVLSFASRTLFG